MKQKSKTYALVQDIIIITLMTIIVIMAIRICGGHITDYVTKKSCDAVNKVYKSSKTPGDGECIDVK